MWLFNCKINAVYCSSQIQYNDFKKKKESYNFLLLIGKLLSGLRFNTNDVYAGKYVMVIFSLNMSPC